MTSQRRGGRELTISDTFISSIVLRKASTGAGREKSRTCGSIRFRATQEEILRRFAPLDDGQRRLAGRTGRPGEAGRLVAGVFLNAGCLGEGRRVGGLSFVEEGEEPVAVEGGGGGLPGVLDGGGDGGLRKIGEGGFVAMGDGFGAKLFEGLGGCGVEIAGGVGGGGFAL